MKRVVQQVHLLGDMLPIDGYQVQLTESLPNEYDASLMHLYLPLIGIEAVSLYQLLLKELALQAEDSFQTHHTLINYLNIPLNEMYQARLKLEGIGLLKTYQRKTEDRTYFTYELKAPFSPQDFFYDELLAGLLHRQLGKEKFVRLKNHYVNNEKKQLGADITANFNDVFETIEPIVSVMPKLEVEKEEKLGVPLQEIVDFTIIKESLERKQIQTQSVFTERNKRMMNQLIHLYHLETHELEKAIEWALTEENTFDVEAFKRVCHDISRMKQNVVPAKLEVKKKVVQEEQLKKPQTKFERLIEKFETASPKDILEDLSSGHNASEQDVQFIRDTMLEQGLPTPVMNVLIHYVMLQSDMKLPRKYVETIASNWSRKKIQTAKEAILYVRKQMNERKKPNKTYPKRKQQEEIIPEWFDKRHQQEPVKTEQLLSKEQEKERAEMLKLLEKYAAKK